MKKNVLTELRSESLSKLLEKLNQAKKELTELYLNLRIGKLKNTRSLFHKRKDISQLLTIIEEKRRQK